MKLSIQKIFTGTAWKLLAIIFLVAIVMGIRLPGVFFSGANLQSMLFQIPEFGLFALAMSMAMLTGGCDLSIVSTANLTAIILGVFLHQTVGESPKTGVETLILLGAFLLGLLIGALAGLLNGCLISFAGVPPILATLGTMSFYGGIGIVITKGSALYDFPQGMKKIGNGYLAGTIPIPALIFIGFVLIMFLTIQKSSFGVKLYMLGTNAKAYEYSGLNRERMILASYGISGILAAISGFIILARTNTANADYGSTYIMQSILVCVLGGVNPKGGFGKGTGIFLATLAIQMLSSGLNIMNVNAYFKQFVYGALLIIMIISNTWDHRTIKQIGGYIR